MSNESLDKLPRWARERIRVLELRLAEETGRLNALFGTVATDTTWCNHTEHPLPKGALIRFRMGDGDDDLVVDVWLRKGRLEVAGRGPIEVRPEAANCLSIGRAR